MAIRVVADTHSILWYLYNDVRLSSAASTLMDRIDQAGDQIAISSITLAEIVYLLEKERIDSRAFEWMIQAVTQVDAALVEAPFDHQIAAAMRQIPRAQVPELPDRIVTATALHLGVPVISRGHKIQSSDITTIW